MKKIFLVLIIVGYKNLFSQTTPTIPDPERIRTYDVQHIKIDVSFDWNQKKVIGDVETRIIPLSDGLSEFEVDAVAFNINYIRDNNGKNLKYDYNGKKIKIKLDKNYSTADTIVYTVDYTCQPQTGLYFHLSNRIKSLFTISDMDTR